LPDGREEAITIQFLDTFPLTFLPDSYIVSTGHGTSGPFNFGGIPLRSLLTHPAGLFPNYDHVEVISADGFGTRIYRSELEKGDGLSRPVLLAWILDGLPMSREQGAVRLVVPTETDDALRQVKWIGRINIRP
jgi:DMSO/TMAO reductase YedYZ molybdopterin-dependent catalytic subunit